MKELNIYITEKLKLNKDIKEIQFNFKEPYLLIQQAIVQGDDSHIYFDSICYISKINEDNGKIEIKFDKNTFNVYEGSYEIINNTIIVSFRAQDGRNILLPKSEAIKEINNLKKNNYVFDYGEYLLGHSKKCIVRNVNDSKMDNDKEKSNKWLNKLLEQLNEKD